MNKRIGTLGVIFLITQLGKAQTKSPNVSQVLMYSTATPSQTVPTFTGPSFQLPQAVPSVFTETAQQATLFTQTQPNLRNPTNFSITQNFVQLNNALNASIASALSIIPLSSPASGVIEKLDPTTGAELPVSSTLGPIFTERAETIGKGKFYVGLSNQDFHFTKYNGTSLNALSILYPGGQPSNVYIGNTQLQTAPVTYGVGMDVRLSQSIAFLTYGLANYLDVSLGLPLIHSAVAARTYNGVSYVGNGFGFNGSSCWGVATFAPGFPVITQAQFGQASRGETGFGDILLRVKGTVVSKPRVAIAVGTDLRFPTGDAQNYLGVGTTTVKPFVAMSFYTKPFKNNFVLSPHFDVGWQFSGKSILGGQLQGSTLTASSSAGNVSYTGAPFTNTKDYLPDVFSWAAGAELATGRRSTIVVDVLGNQIGWVHGIANATQQTINNVLLPTGPNGTNVSTSVASTGVAKGLVSDGRVTLGQYTGSFGYKARLMGNLVANLNVLVRFDNSGLTARVVPLYGLGYTF